MFGCPPLILRNCGREHLRLSCVAISSQSMAASSAMNRAYYRYRRLARMPASNARTAPATVAEPVRARSTICDSGRGGRPRAGPLSGAPPEASRPIGATPTPARVAANNIAQLLGPTAKPRRPASFAPRSRACKNSSGPCTRRATFLSTRRTEMLTAMAGARRMAGGQRHTRVDRTWSWIRLAVAARKLCLGSDILRAG